MNMERIALRIIIAGGVVACIWLAALVGVALHFLVKIW